MRTSNTVPANVHTLVDLLRYRAQIQCNDRALSFYGDSDGGKLCLSYDELDRRARAVAALLLERRLSGERAVLLYQPGAEYVIAFLGCLYAGTVAVPVYAPRMNRSLERIHAIVRSARPEVILSTRSILQNVDHDSLQSEIEQSLQWLTTDGADQALAAQWVRPTIGADTLAFLQYTSGSTGSPKGVMLTHANLLGNSQIIHRQLRTTPESRGVSWLPPYHDMGLIGGILQPLYAGFPGHLMSPAAFLKRPVRWLELISRVRATHSAGPNFAYDLCHRRVSATQRDELDLSNWQVACNGAEPVRSDVIDRFSEYFASCGFRRSTFFPCYGLAESTLFVSGAVAQQGPGLLQLAASDLQRSLTRVVQAGDQDARTLVSSGYPACGLDVRIVDAETRVLRPHGQIGEVWVAGSSVACGYWESPRETEQTFDAYIHPSGDGPFLRTGDLGFIRDGQLFVTGRLKDLIIINGHNHYPQDIEATVGECHEGLRASYTAAFAVEEAGQERLVLVQEVARSHLRRDHAELIRAIRDAVSREHQLQVDRVALIRPGAIPMTSSGKIRRSACRDGIVSGSLASLNLSPSITTTDTQEDVCVC